MAKKQLALFDLTPRAHRAKTRSTGQATQVLKTYRLKLIARGREIAKAIAKRRGKVHSRQVRQQMEKEGLLVNPLIGDFWLGIVFRSDDFKWTGEYFRYSDSARNIHERTVKVWTLA
jgi:hypothetical protein